jgi:hypothetical protein
MVFLITPLTMERPYWKYKDGNIILTMRCSNEVEEKIREKFQDAQSPIFLVLEF